MKTQNKTALVISLNQCIAYNKLSDYRESCVISFGKSIMTQLIKNSAPDLKPAVAAPR